MPLPALTVLLIVSLGLCQEYTNGSCLSSITATSPGCTLSFSPWMPPQIPPTTTLYEAIMTTYFDVVDCRYCTVTIPDSTMAPSAQGPFTAKVTSPMLTISRVGCMLETTAITRRDIRGFSELMESRLRRSIPTDARTHKLEARKMMAQFSGADLQEVANAIAAHVDPDSSQLPERVYNDLVSLNTALFAIEYASQHLNMTEACDEFRHPVEPGQFPDTGIDRNQAGNIFCWGAQFGLYFGISTLELADKIAAAIYILQVGQNFPTDLSQLCSYLDIPFAGFLGVNATRIKQDACGSASGTASTSPVTITSLVPPLTTGIGSIITTGSTGPPRSGGSGFWTTTSIASPLWTNSSRSEATASSNTGTDSSIAWTTRPGAAGGRASTSGFPANSGKGGPSHSASATGWGASDATSVGVGTGLSYGTGVSGGTGISSGTAGSSGVPTIGNGSWSGYTLRTGGTPTGWDSAYQGPGSETGTAAEAETYYGLPARTSKLGGGRKH